MEKVCVTGGRGFIGSHLVNYLKKKGHWVRSVDIRTDCLLPTYEDEFLQLDLRSLEFALVATKGIDWVFNLAANVGGIGYIMTYHAPIMRDNILININMLEASRCAKVQRFFFSSSACVYPSNLQETPDAGPLKESDMNQVNPDSAYGWEKLFTEQLCKYYIQDYGLQTRIARFHNVYGLHKREREREKVPIALCRKVAEASDGGSIVVWGDGKQTRSFLHISDCLDAIYALMKSDYSEPLNVGTDYQISIDALAQLIMKVADKKLAIEHDLTKAQGVRGRNASLTLIRQVLGWTPKISLEQGISELYKFIERETKTL